MKITGLENFQDSPELLSDEAFFLLDSLRKLLRILSILARHTKNFILLMIHWILGYPLKERTKILTKINAIITDTKQFYKIQVLYLLCMILSINLTLSLAISYWLPFMKKIDVLNVFTRNYGIICTLHCCDASKVTKNSVMQAILTSFRQNKSYKFVTFGIR